MIPLERAKEIAQSLVAPLGTEVLPLQQARGRFLAEPLRAARPLPPFDSAAMDGWALRSGETRSATRDRPARLRVRAVAAAGAPPGPPLGPGEAARIFTGAVVPQGADAVLRQEAGAEEGGELRAFAEARPGEHVRRTGEELAGGAVGLAAPCPLDAYALGVAASLGFAEVKVARAPKVALITVGDELVPLGSAPLPYQLHDSNGALVAALCAELGASVAWQERAPDDDGRIRAALEAALGTADLVVTCGGASVGDRDRVKPVLRALGGTLHVDGVLLKPGKPLGVATALGKPVVVLPGNPGAAAVGFDQVARPMLLRMQGATEVRRRVPVRLDAPRRKQAGLEYFLSARVELDGAWPPLARIRPQGAGQLVHAVGAHGWVILPRGRAEFAASEEHAMELFAFPGVGMTVPALSIVGWSGAGKTALAVELLRRFRARGLRVLAVKHSADAHAPAPGPDTDTARFLAAGAAEAYLVSGGAPVELPAEGFDLALVEGWKAGPLPKLEVWREGLEPPLTAEPLVLARAPDLDEVAERALALAGGAKKSPAVRERTTVRPVRRAGQEAQPWAEAPDDVAVEEPLEIRISGEAVAVTMRTPGDDLDLAVGFLFAEGLIHGAADLGSVAHCGRPDDEGYGNLVEVTPAPGVQLEVERMDATRRGTLTTSACGVCGRRSVDDLMARVGRVPDGAAVSAELIASAPDRLRREQRAFARTGGMHGAAIFDGSGRLLAVAEDVGRHNAVDKAVGALVRRGVIATAPPLGTRPPAPAQGEAPALLVVSGRASFEIVQKAAAARLPAIAAVGAGSSLAVDLAQRAGIVLCTFVRDGKFNVYSRADRIRGAPAPRTTGDS